MYHYTNDKITIVQPRPHQDLYSYDLHKPID